MSNIVLNQDSVNELETSTYTTLEIKVIKDENIYLKQIIQELRETNKLLNQNKQLLEEKVVHIEKQLEILQINSRQKREDKLPNKKRTINNSSNTPLLNSVGTHLSEASNQNTLFVFPSPNTQAANQIGDVDANSVAPLSWARIVASQPESTKLPRNNNNNTLRPKNKVFIGSGEAEPTDNFTGRDDKLKKVWLFISKVPDSVDASIIKNYITKKINTTNEEDVIVKHLPTRIEQSNPNSRCFQVGIKFEFKETVYDTKFWPKNVAFQRFKFRRQYQEEKREHPTDPPQNDFLSK